MATPALPQEKPKIVVVMGAGASADFGVPTLRSIFKNTQADAYLKKDKTLHDWLQAMFWEPRGQSATTSDQSITVEEMLTVLRDWEGENSVESPARTETDDIRRRLYVLIYHAVFEGKSSQGKHLNSLIDLLGRNFSKITWASFNWDCIFEASFFYHSGPPQPGARYNPELAIKLEGWRTGSAKHEYLKLHGSVNWWLIGDKPTALSWGSGGELKAKWAELEQGKTGDRPIILEPSAYKYEGDLYESILHPQWERFLASLCGADCVLIVGYSLPDNDLQARCKMLTAFQVNHQCLWAVVDSGEESRRKYQRLLGSKRLQTFDSSLAGFRVNLLDNLKKAFPGIDITALPLAGVTMTPAPVTATP